MPRPRLLAAVLACLASPAVVFAAAPAPQDDADPAAEPEFPRLDEIEPLLEEVRKLKFRRDVPAERQSAEDFRAYVEEELQETMPAEDFDDIVAGLEALGMVRERFDLGREIVDAMVSQAGAYYDPESGTFYYLMTDVDPFVLKILAAHELVHALQDQHFDLQAMVERMEELADPEQGVRQDDLVLAWRSLVEGEATYVQNLWQVKSLSGNDLTANPEMERAALGLTFDTDLYALARMGVPGGVLEGDLAEAMEAMKDIPPYLMVPLYAAYMRGGNFTMRVRQAGGWDAVDAVYTDLPASTEQILHPEKYLAEDRDDPTPITLPDLPSLAEAGWEPIDAAVHGELYLNLLLRQAGLDRAAADRAAAGWDGDVYRAWRREDGRILLALATTWDTPEDATEFFDALGTATRHRYAGREPVEDDAARVRFEGEDGGSLLVRRDREVFLVRGGEPAELDALAEKLLATPVGHRD